MICYYLNCSVASVQVRVSINRRIEMPPAFLFPESDPPPSDLVPEHQQQHSSILERQQLQQHTSTSENGANHQSIQQQQQQLSPGSSASGDSVDASPIVLPKSSGLNHHMQQILAEEYTLPDLFPPHPVSNQNIFSSPSAGMNKMDHFMNLNNHLNSQHLHRNAQALIESLGHHTSQLPPPTVSWKKSLLHNHLIIITIILI